MSKAIKATLAAIGPRQAVVVGKEAPVKLPKGAILLQFGKTYALQREATNVVESLPGKLPAAAKALAESGGIVTAKVAKASGLEFNALLAKVQANKAVTVTASATKFAVTPRAKRADLLPLGGEAPVATKPGASKATKSAPKAAPVSAKAPKATAKKGKEAAQPAKGGKPAAKKGSKAAPAAAKAAPKKAAAKSAAPAKGKPAPAKAKGKPAKDIKPAKPAKGKKG